MGLDLFFMSSHLGRKVKVQNSWATIYFKGHLRHSYLKH